MKRFAIITITLVSTIACLTPNSFAGDFPAQLTSKSFFKNLDWKDGKTIEKISSDWKNYTGEQGGNHGEGFKDRLILKETTVEIDGINFEASTRKFLGTGYHEIVYYAGAGDYEATPRNLGYCNRLIKKYTSQFGSPNKLIDLSEETSSPVAKIDIAAQWDINNTRIVVKCFATKIYKGFIPFVTLQYSNKYHVEPILDPIHLRCTKKRKGTGQLDDGKITEEPPFTLTIKQNKKILSSKSVRLGKTVAYSDRKIVTSLIDDKQNIKGIFSLDRYTGSYVWVVESTKYRGLGRKLWGNCEQFSFKKRF